MLTEQQIVTITGCVVSTILTIAGMIISIKAKTHSHDPVEGEINGKGKFKMPFNVGTVAAIIGGVILCALIQAVFYNGTDKAKKPSYDGNVSQQQGVLNFSFISSAYAAYGKERNPGNWVYFGPEDHQNDWQFKFVVGKYADIVQKESDDVVLKTLTSVNVREFYMGFWHGTFLDFLESEPKIKNVLPPGRCVLVKNYARRGFGKVWLDIDMVSCPSVPVR